MNTKDESRLTAKNNTVIVRQLLYKINNLGKLPLVLLVCASLSACSISEIKPDHGLQKSPCACGVVYDSREVA